MQTFLPYADFRRSARCLDYRRLGKQRVECKQILRALRGESRGWKNHPAVRMWRGFEAALCRYAIDICAEWRARGYQDSLLPYFETALLALPSTSNPPWLGREDFHASHRSALLRKRPDFYAVLEWNEPPDLPYVWPVLKEIVA